MAGSLAALLLALLLVAKASAGGHVFRHLTVDDGLPQMSVIDIVKDHRGFMWFATTDGVARYDGYEFVTFRHDPADPHSLPTNNVNTMVLDSAGLLWVGTDTGLAVINTNSLAYVAVPQFSRAGPVIELFRQQETVWLLLKQQLYQFRGLQNVRSVKLPSTAGTRHSIIPAEGKLLFRDAGQLLWWLAADNTWLPAELPALTESSGLYQAGESLFWFTPEQFYVAPLNDISAMRSVEWPTRYAKHLMTLVSFVHQRNNGDYWVGIHGHGILVFDNQLQFSDHIKSYPQSERSLSTAESKSVFEDEQAVWVGLLGGGVNVFWKRENRFLQLSAQSEPSLGDPFIRGVGEYEEALLVATNTRLAVYSDNGLQYEQQKDISAEGECAHVNTFPVSYVTRRGELWVGGDNKQEGDCNLFKLESERHVLTPARGLMAANNDKITAMFEDHEGYLWVASLNGLYRIAQQASEDFSWLYEAAGIPKNQIIWHISQDADHRLWLATHHSGILLVDPLNQSVKRLHADSEPPNGLPPGQIKTVLHASNGVTWVGSSLGLYRFDRKTETFSGFTVKDGLANAHIYGLLEDDAGNLWMSTNDGLSRFSPSSGQFWNLSVNDGLQGREFNTGAYLKRQNGHLVFGGINGVTQFDPAQVTPQVNASRVQISRLRLLDESREVAITPPQKGPLSLNYDHVQLALSVSNLDFINQQEVAYRYQLLPLSKQWVSILPGENAIYFSQLPSGAFELNIQSRNHDQQWSEPQRLLAITVTPAPWFTWWAFCLYAIAAVGVLTLGYQWRLRQLRQRQQQLEGLVEERTVQLSKQSVLLDENNQLLRSTLEEKNRIFADITHEFKTPLTLILNPVKDLLASSDGNQANSLTLVQRNALRLNHLVNQLIGFNDMTQPDEEHSVAHLQQVISSVASDFDKMAAARGMKIEWHCPEVTVGLSVPALELIMGNLLSNAVKYGEAKSTIRLTAETASHEQCTVTVFSQGVPIPASADLFERFYRLPEHRTGVAGSRLGLALVKQTLDNYQGAVHFEAQHDGNAFIVILPVVTPQQNLVTEPGQSAKAYESALALMSADKVLQLDKNEQQAANELVIVEDDPDMSWILANKLSGHFSVNTVDSGQAAIERITEHIPDIVILDFMLPDITGYQVLQAVRGNELTCHIPVLMLTAKHDRDTRLRSKEALVDAFLTKPFDDEELVLTLFNLLQIRQLIGQKANTALTGQQQEPVFDSPSDQQFYNKLNAVLNECAVDADFGLSQLADQLFISERQLQRKCKSVFNLTPNAYIRNYRLQKARQLLEQGERVSLVVEQCGFSSHSYFSQCFKALFNVTPSEFIDRHPRH